MSLQGGGGGEGVLIDDWIVRQIDREGVCVLIVPGESRGRALMRAKHSDATPTAGSRTGAWCK